jgi:hypothetical protein
MRVSVLGENRDGGNKIEERTPSIPIFLKISQTLTHFRSHEMALHESSVISCYSGKLKLSREEPLWHLNVKSAPETGMSKKPDMVMVIITLFVVSVLASSVAQSALM